MKIKYILQIKRRYYWEDILNFYDKRQAFGYYLQLLDEGMQVRLIEQVIACV